jgi:hypothetical protein
MDQLGAEAATYTTQENIHTLSRIRTHDSSNIVAADLRRRPRGHQDRQIYN